MMNRLHSSDVRGRNRNHCRKIANDLDPKAIIFGSVAKGTSTENNDFDLRVILETDHPYYERTLAIKRSVGVTSIPRDIIAFTPAEIDKGRSKKNSIISEALSTGKVVYDTV